MNEFIDVAVKLAGGQRAMARELGVSNTAVYKWVKNNRIPVHHCKRAAELARGYVTPGQLNPEYNSRKHG